MRKILIILSVLVLAIIVFAGQWLETTFENSTLVDTVLAGHSIYLSAVADQIYGGDGTDGVLNVASANTVVNKYTYLTQDSLVGATKLYGNDASDFAPGDEILVLQTQVDPSVVGGAVQGAYEFKWIESIAGNDITLKTAIANSYYSGTFYVDPSEVTQIIKVPQYTSVTVGSGKSIVASAWDGYKGGVVCFRCQGDVKVVGTISTTAQGFREEPHGGGDTGCNHDGEGSLGRGNGDLNRNGTGGAYSGNGPGCGGGHGTAGQSMHSGQGGCTIGDFYLNTLHFGGAGGNGRGHYGCGGGGDGGGIIFILCKNLYIEGSIQSKGNGSWGGGWGHYGGGGAGGSVFLKCNGAIENLNKVNADGEPGKGSGSYLGGYGGTGRIAAHCTTYTGGNSSPSAYVTSLKFLASGNSLIPTHDCTFTREWGTFNWNWNGTQTLTFKVETKNLDSGWDLDNASQVTIGQDISSLASVTDGHRYIRWKAFLSSSADTESPELEDVTINYSAEPDKIEWIYVK